MHDATRRRYAVKILPSAQRDCDALDRTVAARLIPVIQKLADDPRPYGSIKLSAEEGHRLRVGAYRVVYRVDDQARNVFIYRIKHRREAYR